MGIQYASLALIKASSALMRSPSLIPLNGPPPGVLAPDNIEPVRERTFITSGLKRSRSASRDRRPVQVISQRIPVLLFRARPSKSTIIVSRERLHLNHPSVSDK